MKPKQFLLIYNPSAKSIAEPHRWLGTVINHLSEELDCTITIRATKTELSEETIFSLVQDTFDMVIAAGGDGTIRYVAHILAKSKSSTPLAIIPVGTGNLLAKNLGILSDGFLADPVEQALNVILSGTIRSIDLGIMNNQHFAVAAGAGPMSDAIMLPEREDKTSWKMLAYANSMMQTFAMPPVIFAINTDGHAFKITASGVFVTNVSDLGTGRISETIEPNDGYLDLLILNPSKFADYVDLGFRFCGGFLGGETPYYTRKIKTVDIEVVPMRSTLSGFQQLGHTLRSWLRGKWNIPHPIHKEVTAMLDGDANGTTPMHIEVVSEAVKIIVPTTPL